MKLVRSRYAKNSGFPGRGARLPPRARHAAAPPARHIARPPAPSIQVEPAAARCRGVHRLIARVGRAPRLAGEIPCFARSHPPTSHAAEPTGSLTATRGSPVATETIPPPEIPKTPEQIERHWFENVYQG